ncbi:hypothetical protein [Nocardia acidivorans]|uniref:hypothetical protein n=1 Tax=Nocardia acidivorans TaxID=404580 RepID=UPI0008302497|nr:hypothetical protein [Nocardia acidivorans]
MARIPCKFKDGTPVDPEVADMIASAFGFTSAPDMERIIAEGEIKRRKRGIITRATLLGQDVAQDHRCEVARETRLGVVARKADAA